MLPILSYRILKGDEPLWKIVLGLLDSFRLEYLCILLASSLLSASEGIFHPILIKSIFDEIVAKHDFRRFMFLIVVYLALGLSISLLSAGTALWSKSLENRLVKSVTERLLISYYHKEYASVLHNGYGYFINRISGDVRDGLVPLLSLVQTTLNQTVLLASLSCVLVYLSWKAFAFLAAIIPLSATFGGFLGRKIKRLASQEREQEGAVLAILTKALSAFRMVKSFDLHAKTAAVFDEKFRSYLLTGYRRYRISRLFQTLNDLTMVICDFLSLFVGALFVLRGALTFGGYLAFVNAFWRAVTTLTQLFKSVPDIHNFGVIIRRIVSFLSPSMAAYYQMGAAPSVRDVRFSFGDRDVFKDFSLHLAPGERVVIVGPNGSGKTTLANILSGYLAPLEGEVLLPERICSITLPILFPPLKVKDLVGDAGILGIVGLDVSVLEQCADDLSAGQQQKLAILMVLAKDADLYIIDEPLANLDNESRHAIMKLILEKTREKSLIVIMHGSEEYHKHFDRVIRLEYDTHNRRPQEVLVV